MDSMSRITESPQNKSSKSASYPMDLHIGTPGKLGPRMILEVTISFLSCDLVLWVGLVDKKHRHF